MSFNLPRIGLPFSAGCTLSPWTPFSRCSVLSGTGGQIRSRSCQTPSPNYTPEFEIQRCGSKGCHSEISLEHSAGKIRKILLHEITIDRMAFSQ